MKRCELHQYTGNFKKITDHQNYSSIQLLIIFPTKIQNKAWQNTIFGPELIDMGIYLFFVLFCWSGNLIYSLKGWEPLKSAFAVHFGHANVLNYILLWREQINNEFLQIVYLPWIKILLSSFWILEESSKKER